MGTEIVPVGGTHDEDHKCDPFPIVVDQRLVALEVAVNRLADELAYMRLKMDSITTADKAQPGRGSSASSFASSD